MGVGQVLEDLKADRAVAGHHALVLDRVHEQPVDPVDRAGDDRLPPVVVGQLDHLAAQALDRGQLGLRSVLGDGDRGREAELAPGPGDALGHVAGTRGDQTAVSVGLGGKPDGVGGAADLERADRLERLELQIDLGSVRDLGGVQPHERSTHGDVGNPGARGLDLA